jgi:hypothetical protein
MVSDKSLKKYLLIAVPMRSDVQHGRTNNSDFEVLDVFD